MLLCLYYINVTQEEWFTRFFRKFVHESNSILSLSKSSQQHLFYLSICFTVCISYSRVIFLSESWNSVRTWLQASIPNNVFVNPDAYFATIRQKIDFPTEKYKNLYLIFSPEDKQFYSNPSIKRWTGGMYRCTLMYHILSLISFWWQNFSEVVLYFLLHYSHVTDLITWQIKKQLKTDYNFNNCYQVICQWPEPDVERFEPLKCEDLLLLI